MLELLGIILLMQGGANPPEVPSPPPAAAVEEPRDARGWILHGKAALRAADRARDSKPLHEACSAFEAAIAVEGDEHEGLALYHLAHAESRLATLPPDEGESDPMSAYLPKAVEHAEAALERLPESADVKALLASLYGMSMGLDPMAGMRLGPKAGRLDAEALAAAPENPRAWISHGCAKLFTPPMFGGSVDGAIESFEKAREAAAAEHPAELAPEWGRLEAEAWLGQALWKAGRIEEARTAFQRALEIEPECAWVKHHLLAKLPPPPEDESAAGTAGEAEDG